MKNRNNVSRFQSVCQFFQKNDSPDAVGIEVDNFFAEHGAKQRIKPTW